MRIETTTGALAIALLLALGIPAGLEARSHQEPATMSLEHRTKAQKRNHRNAAIGAAVLTAAAGYGAGSLGGPSDCCDVVTAINEPFVGPPRPATMTEESRQIIIDTVDLALGRALTDDELTVLDITIDEAMGVGNVQGFHTGRIWVQHELCGSAPDL